LSDEVIEAIENMKSFWKSGLIPDKPIADADKMLRDLDERAVKLGQGIEAGSRLCRTGIGYVSTAWLIDENI